MPSHLKGLKAPELERPLALDAHSGVQDNVANIADSTGGADGAVMASPLHESKHDEEEGGEVGADAKLSAFLFNITRAIPLQMCFDYRTKDAILFKVRGG